MISFDNAVAHLKAGTTDKISRSGWNGKGMYVFLISDWIYPEWEDHQFESLPFLAMKTADNKVVPWLASQTDILADDWLILPLEDTDSIYGYDTLSNPQDEQSINGTGGTFENLILTAVVEMYDGEELVVQTFVDHEDNLRLVIEGPTKSVYFQQDSQED